MTKTKDTPVKEKLNLPQAPKTFDELVAIAELYGVSIPIQAPFTPNDVNKLMPLLRLPLDEDAIQESKGSETKKGYDTTGYSYQAHVDRMNWVFGPTNWTWRIHNEFFDDSYTSSGGNVKFIYSSEIELLIGYRELNPESKQWEWLTVHSVPPIPTDHESYKEKGSARKGMLTKGIKRATSFLGVGADAYLGVLDDDLVTGAEPGDDMRTKRKFEDQFIDPKGYGQIKDLAKLKGLTDSKLREFYKARSEGNISNDPANLTRNEASQVKRWLMDLPDHKEKEPETIQTPEIEEGEKAPEEQPEQTEETSYPETLAELLAADETLIRKIAAEFSFQMPPQLTDKNKSAICKTLGHLMGLK